jgi:hypothetical protein
VVTTRNATTRHLTAAIALCALSATAAHAQVRGLPLFFDPTYSYETRLGVDAGNGGELGGFVWALSASRLFYIGNCPKLAVSAAAGLWHPADEEISDGFNGGLTASYLMNPCPTTLSTPNPTVRAVIGGGWTRVNDRTALNVPIGGEVGYMIETAVARVEPWAGLRAHYLEPTGPDGSSTWRAGLSLGLNVGVASSAGGRIAVDFGSGRTGVGGGLSLWW